MKVSMTVNGTTREGDVEPRTLLVHYIREHLGLTGTNIGCDTSSCGACTVHVDGESVKSCTMLAVQADGCTVTTIEGLHPAGEHPLQVAWRDVAVPQCGFCQSGQIMQAATLLARTTQPTNADIEAAMNGHLCRCGTYPRIRAAIAQAAAQMRGETSK